MRQNLLQVSLVALGYIIGSLDLMATTPELAPEHGYTIKVTRCIAIFNQNLGVGEFEGQITAVNEKLRCEDFIEGSIDTSLPKLKVWDKVFIYEKGIGIGDILTCDNILRFSLPRTVPGREHELVVGNLAGDILVKSQALLKTKSK